MRPLQRKKGNGTGPGRSAAENHRICLGNLLDFVAETQEILPPGEIYRLSDKPDNQLEHINGLHDYEMRQYVPTGPKSAWSVHSLPSE